MSKLIITVSGRPSMDGYSKREFKWSEPHKAFIYEGREFLDSEFNAKFERAWSTNGDLMPKARVVATDLVGAAPAVTHVTTLAAAKEVTADEAEEILTRLRPDRLKKKTAMKSFMEVG